MRNSKFCNPFAVLFFHTVVHHLYMNTQVTLLHPDEWARVKDLRLRSLRESPDAFGGDLVTESAFSEIQWRSKFSQLDYLVATISSEDIAIMSVEVLDGDHGATCWIGGCWSDPDFRGQGAFSALFRFVDFHSESKGWQRQGLGVWTDNFSAIEAYRALGFIDAGERQESERRSGRFYMHMVRDSKARSLD
jgi:RimJ/RimL family protein N-acetyltransferase